MQGSNVATRRKARATWARLITAVCFALVPAISTFALLGCQEQARDFTEARRPQREQSSSRVETEINGIPAATPGATDEYLTAARAFANGDFCGAESSARRAVKLDTKFEVARFLLILAYLEMSELDKAQAALDDAVSICGASRHFLRARALLAYQRGHLDEAKSLLDDLLVTDPSDSYCLSLRARIHHEKMEYTEAARDIDIALKAHPANADLLRLRSEIAARLGDSDASLTYWGLAYVLSLNKAEVVSQSPSGYVAIARTEEMTSLALIKQDGEIEIADMCTLKTRTRFRPPHATRCASFQGREELIVGSTTGEISSWGCADGSPVFSHKVFACQVVFVGLERNDKSLVAVSEDGEVRRFSWPGGKEIGIPSTTNCSIQTGALDPRRRHLALGVSDGGVSIAVTGAGYQFERVMLPFLNSSLAWSPIRDEFYFGTEERKLTCWSYALSRPVWTTTGYDDHVRSVCCSFMGDRVACGLDNGEIYILNAKDGRELVELKAGLLPVTSMSFGNEEGTVLVVPGLDGCLRKYDLHMTE